MMLTIHGLPTTANYHELKRLIKQECSITDFILDSLVMDDDGRKKVRIGVTDDCDGSQLMKYLNGYNWLGHMIRIVPVGKANQQNHNFEARGSFTARHDYHNQPNNFGNQQVGHDSQPTRLNTWVPNVQWGQGVPPHAAVPQNTYVNQPQAAVTNTAFPHQPGRNFAPGRVSHQTPEVQQRQQQQGFGYLPKNNQSDRTGPSQFEHQSSIVQGPFHSHSHAQPSWTPQVQPVKSQPFEKLAAGTYNQMGFNDSRHAAKPGSLHETTIKDYNKSDRRFELQRDTSPSKRLSPRRRVSPGPARRLSPSASAQGRRMSPSGMHGRKASPPGSQGRRISSPARKISPHVSHVRRISPSGPQGRRMSPIGPHDRKMSPSGPHGRRLSPSAAHGRRMSPSGPHARRVSPPGAHERRMSPSERRVSPGYQGRRMSPARIGAPAPNVRGMSPHPGPYDRKMPPASSQGRRMSPTGLQPRRMSPHSMSGRRMSDSPPGRRMSSADRRMVARHSPARRGSPKRHSSDRRSGSPSGSRPYPPSFHQSKKSKYETDSRSSHLKQVRPAYEPPTKAANQAIYSGAYRPNIHENAQYSPSNTRQETWQLNPDKPAAYPPPKNQESRIEKFDIPRASDHIRMGDAEPKRSRSGTRDSRSPIRRDRSPFKDRYRRHSPSPRSPRRSWALEKRRSPDIRDAPPPPVWPGQNVRDPEFSRHNRHNFSDVIEKIDNKHAPTWERPSFDDRIDVVRHGKGPEAGRAAFTQNTDKWNTVSQSSSKDFKQNERFSDNTREIYTSKEEYERPIIRELSPYTDKRVFKDYVMKKDIPLRREDFSRGDDDRREVFRTNPAVLNKEIEDVYKRVAELGKKAQEYRKKESRFEAREDQFFEQKAHSLHRDREDKGDFITDNRFQLRDEETTAHQNNEVDQPVRQRESRWSNTDFVWRPKKPLSLTVKAKRDRAAEEIARRLMNRFKNEISDAQKNRVRDELTLTFGRMFYDMFKDEDVSYVEIVIRFNKKYNADDEARIFGEVMSSFSSNYRKRGAPDEAEIPAKTSKPTPDIINRDVGPQAASNWNLNVMQAATFPANAIRSASIVPAAVGPLVAQLPHIVNQKPSMVPPPPYASAFEHSHKAGLMSISGFNLYLCKIDLQPFNDVQADQLKNYLISQMIEETEKIQGWAPDFILKGLQSLHRYEIVTQDARSRDWLLDLDFSDFSPFSVLVYTGEELWYERAAIWLPGHSRYRNIEPLQKLKLQNKNMQGVDVGKWKFVKQVVTAKGIRIYVDLPSSSARALENYKMMLSYELQKVSVFLKAVAVDKDAFDAGLQEKSVEVVPSFHNKTMPSLGHDLNVVKIGLKGTRHTTLSMTHKIKDRIVFRLYQYLLQGGTSRTDFLKYGFCSPGYLGVVPENKETRQWIIALHIGALNRKPIVVMGGDESNMRYIKMYIILPSNHNLTNTALACEKLKQSNQGVKGINFNAWKNAKLIYRKEGITKLVVEMDLESVETIINLNYELDYVDEGQDCLSAKVKSDYSHSNLEELIKKYRAELSDTYDIASMDIESDSDGDIVCLN